MDPRSIVLLLFSQVMLPTEAPPLPALLLPETKGIQVGTPVFVKGKQVGKVARIVPPPKRGRRYQFQLALDSDAELKEGTVGLLTSRMAPDPQTVVELFVPEEGKPATLEQIPGYMSYEEFWSAGRRR